MSNFVHNFITSLEISGTYRELANTILRSKEDCEQFYEMFLGRSNSMNNDLLEFRHKKIANSTMSLEEFSEHCKDIVIDKDFLCDVFLQPFKDLHFELIMKAIDDGRTTLNDMYYQFCNNPNNNIMKYVL